jgi:hypothetical protein
MQWSIQVCKRLVLCFRYPFSIIFDDLPIGCEVIWSFFATSHGKCEVDCVGALLKREIKKKKIKLQGKKL